MREIVKISMQRRQNAIISKPCRDREMIKESYKPRGRLLGHNLVVYTLLLYYTVMGCVTVVSPWYWSRPIVWVHGLGPSV